MAYDEAPTQGHESDIAAAQPQTLFLGALAASVLILAAAAALDVVPWPVAILGVAAVATTRVAGGRWFALGAGAVFAVMVIVLETSGVGRTDYVERAAVSDSTARPQIEATVGSLGVTLSELAERWNALEQPPSITGGLVRESETGPYDSFRYRFDAAASLAGAFDPTDDSVHALLGSVGLGHDSAPHFYLHLCFMLHPYSQECIDAYLEDGLGGKPLSDYVGVEHRAEWVFGDQLWRLEIIGDVQNIRILGEAVR
jgi:hypothetical protein